jgi:DNA-binding beta-propeller fold protein YncE
MLAALVFGAVGGGMAGGRLAATAATDVVGTPRQGPHCVLTQGADPRGGPAPLPRAKEARGQATTRTPQGASAVLRAVADIPLPGRPVRFDYQTQDARSGRLYISHMNDGHVLVFDTRTRQVVGTVSGTPGVTGVWVVAELKKLYASVTGRHYVAVIDTDSLTVQATPGPIGFPDGIAYAPVGLRIR